MKYYALISLLCMSSCAMLPEFLTLAEEVAVETVVHGVEHDMEVNMNVKKNEAPNDGH